VWRFHDADCQLVLPEGGTDAKSGAGNTKPLLSHAPAEIGRASASLQKPTMVWNTSSTSSPTTRANKRLPPFPWPPAAVPSPTPFSWQGTLPALPSSPPPSTLAKRARHKTSMPRRRHVLSAGAFVISCRKRSRAGFDQAFGGAAVLVGDDLVRASPSAGSRPP